MPALLDDFAAQDAVVEMLGRVRAFLWRELFEHRASEDHRAVVEDSSRPKAGVAQTMCFGGRALTEVADLLAHVVEVGSTTAPATLIDLGAADEAQECEVRVCVERLDNANCSENYYEVDLCYSLKPETEG